MGNNDTEKRAILLLNIQEGPGNQRGAVCVAYQKGAFVREKNFGLDFHRHFALLSFFCITPAVAGAGKHALAAGLVNDADVIGVRPAF